MLSETLTSAHLHIPFSNSTHYENDNFEKKGSTNGLFKVPAGVH